MAIPLNVFKTTATVLAEEPPGGFTGDSDVVYTVPNGITTIVLMAQVANTDSAEHTTTFSHFNTNDTESIELVKNLPVAPNDALGLITGKLIVEQQNKVRASVSQGSGNNMKLTLSYLESLNG